MYTVEDIMSRPVVTTEAGRTVAEAVQVMRQHRISSLLVRPEAPGDPYGIITKRDVVAKVVAAGLDPAKVRVRQVMSKPVLTVPPHCTLQECSRLMARAGVRRLPVFRDGEPVGIVSDTDLFAAVEEAGWGPGDRNTSRRERHRAHLARRLSGVVPDPEALAESILLELGH